jgi:hypothetical protein
MPAGRLGILELLRLAVAAIACELAVEKFSRLVLH